MKFFVRNVRPNVLTKCKDKERKQKMNKKLILAVGAAALSVVAFAGPHGGPGGRGPRPGPRPGMMHHGPRPGIHHPPPPRHHSGWGRGGREFWPGFVGGVVGGLAVGTIRPVPAPVVTTTVVTSPTVVTTPTIVTTTPVVAAPVTQVQNVWVEGRYVDQIQPNGSIIRVWQPGHYEQRTVTIP